MAWRGGWRWPSPAAPAVLESRDAERAGEHARLDEQRAREFRQVVQRGPITDFALDVGTRLVPNFDARIQGADDLQRLAVSCPGSPPNDDRIGLRRLLRARVPHAGATAHPMPT